jgi:Concanavalin A-like lectin/glucanases superfamily
MREGFMLRLLLSVLLSFFVAYLNQVQGEDHRHLAADLIFHAPFDNAFDAAVIPEDGDRSIYTSESLERKTLSPGIHCEGVTIDKGAGRYGDAIRFAKKINEVVLYKATAEAFRPRQNWEGTISLWMRVNPDEDLEEGYCDPLQYAQREWNDATFFLDFDRDLPRDFRLGAFADYRFWNPKDTPWEQIAKQDRPMVVAKKPPFSRDAWTHVAFTFENVNATNGQVATTTLYLQGESAGKLQIPLQFTWEASEAETVGGTPAIMLGIYYIGLMDDLAVFRRALKPEEIKAVYKLPHGVSDLVQAN